MKAMKYLVILAAALFAFASASNAQSLQFLGGGSSALFLELGQAAATLEGANACIWTANTGDQNIAAKDTRPTTADIQTGKVWVIWDKGTGTDCYHPAGSFNVYSYLSVDSVIGDRCYFATDAGGSGCTAVYTPTSGEADTAGNLLGAGFLDTAASATCGGSNPSCIIPTTVTSFLNGKRWFVAGTDIRPEDAKFATFRALTSCTTGIFRSPFGGGLTSMNGLGYNVNGAQAGLVGEPIQSFYSAPTFSVINFNISGNDPFNTTLPVPAYTVNTVGAQPIVVSVSPAGGTGLGAATDINTFTLTLFYNGVLGRATDLLGPTANPSFMTVLVREPLSGTFNTFEYSVPNSNEFHTTQELANCNGGTGAEASNPMNLQSGNGITPTARRRVLGTGEMVGQLQGTPAGENRLGYWFWSAGNGSKFTAANGKYLTVNGVDPLLPTYGATCGGAANNGLIPTGANLSCVTFQNLNSGDYPIWSALRLVTTNPAPAGVTNLIAAAQTLNSTQNDFIPLSKLNVWHSHFALPQVNVGAAALGATINPATPGDLCNSAGVLAELGGDAGGANVLKAANHDFCSDFSNTTGLINANN
jgi:hypothetical protein